MPLGPTEAPSARNKPLAQAFVVSLAWLAAWSTGWTPFASAEEPAAKPEKPATERRPFVRVKNDDSGRPQALETVLLKYELGTPPTATVDLIGAVHVGEEGYYDDLNKRFESYEVVLYELVAPEGTRIEKGDLEKRPASAVGGLQSGMQNMLGLQHQLHCIDYTKKNFVHADMSPEEFEKTMTVRGESWASMFFRSMGYGMAAQSKPGAESGEMELLAALFSRDREIKLRRAFAKQLDSMEGQLAALGGKNGSTIIEKRNEKALEVLRKQLDSGKKNIAVFYGAGHFQDMDRRLKTDFGMRAVGEEWLHAWNLALPERAKAPAVEAAKP